MPESYYTPKHQYEMMVIEGTRLLGLPDKNNNCAYGSYVRVKDTGETCFAAGNGLFFDHKETQRMVDAKAKRMLKGYHQTDTFVWHPIVFPYIEVDGKRMVDFAYYIRSNNILNFPMQFWGHESYDKQIQWIIEREGLSGK